MADMQAELAEAEERNKALELKLTHAAAREQQAQSECEVLDAQADKLRQELSAASLRAERAAQIRNTCRRLSSLEGRLKPIADERDGGRADRCQPADEVLEVLAVRRVGPGPGLVSCLHGDEIGRRGGPAAERASAAAGVAWMP